MAWSQHIWSFCTLRLAPFGWTLSQKTREADSYCIWTYFTFTWLLQFPIRVGGLLPSLPSAGFWLLLFFSFDISVGWPDWKPYCSAFHSHSPVCNFSSPINAGFKQQYNYMLSCRRCRRSQVRSSGGRGSKIILLLERGKIKTGPGSCLQEGVKAKCHGVWKNGFKVENSLMREWVMYSGC